MKIAQIAFFYSYYNK